MMSKLTISVVTPTLRRPNEVEGMVKNICRQQYLPSEIILVDGAPNHETQTQSVVKKINKNLPFNILYIRKTGGTAVQRNSGIEAAKGKLICFIDDDIRLENDFFKIILSYFQDSIYSDVGGIVGYRTNETICPKNHRRWIWYKRLGIYKSFEPGRYDYQTGYPINANLQSPFRGAKEVDFMTTACAVWRREVMDNGLRFDKFFKDYGIMEDAHFSLRAGERWKLLQVGDARCIHLRSEKAREDPFLVASKTAINYRYLFIDIIKNRTFMQEIRFWRVQIFDLCHFVVYALRHWGKDEWLKVFGKANGILKAIQLKKRNDKRSKKNI